MPQANVVIVGAGLAGLCCGLRLQERNIPFRILETSDRPGGRVRTDRVNGFLLDRGFQVLLTAYPEAQRVLDYGALQLQSFRPGAMVYTEGAMHRVADPLRAPLSALPGVFSPVGTLLDKLRVLKLRSRVVHGSLEAMLSHPERSALDELEGMRFTPNMIERFFRPFLGGIFLERELETSSRKMEFVFRMFSEGKAALPARGMQAIPEQIAARLPAESIDFGTQVTRIDGPAVSTAQGTQIEAATVVIATGQPQAMKLLGRDSPPRAFGTVCLYFEAPEPPISGPWLVLNGEGNGPVNNLCIPSNVAPGYAPTGRALISVSVVGDSNANDQDLEVSVRQQLERWFGSVAGWKHLRTYRIPFALPAQTEGKLSPVAKPARITDRVLCCGDHMDIASIHGAMLSGRRAADSIAP